MPMTMKFLKAGCPAQTYREGIIRSGCRRGGGGGGGGGAGDDGDDDDDDRFCSGWHGTNRLTNIRSTLTACLQSGCCIFPPII